MSKGPHILLTVGINADIEDVQVPKMIFSSI
jgi:hypothetical protein